MVTVYVSAVIPAPALEVWQLVRDFNALPEWTPFVTESRIEKNMPADQLGCVRHFKLNDGGIIRERLLALSDYDMRFQYCILESPMPITDYLAWLSLTPITTSNQTFAEWKATFETSEGMESTMQAQIGNGVFAAALDSLQQRYRR